MLAMVLWTSVEGHPFAQVAYLWVWGVSSFNLILGFNDSTLPTSLSLVSSLLSWPFEGLVTVCSLQPTLDQHH